MVMRRKSVGSCVGVFVGVCVLGLMQGVWCGTPAQWQTRTIYQIVTDRFATNTTFAGHKYVPESGNFSEPPLPACAQNEVYCGGTFQGIINHLDYITGMGFDAIWISPVVANIGDNYHGYAAQNLYQINPHFGGASGLEALIEACHAAGVWVMVDLVANHMGIPPNYDYSIMTPFNSASDYHDCSQCPSNCWIQDFTNQPQVEVCRLDGLPDLNQNNSYVSNTLQTWISQLVANYSIDGLRIDTVEEVHPNFWTLFQSAAGVYAVGEVDNGDVTYVAPYQSVVDGLLSYPLYWTLISVFAQGQSMYNIRVINDDYATDMENVNLLGTFIDNHDNPRFLNYTDDYALYSNALVYTLFSTGIPIIYYGTEQGFSGGDTPDNRIPMWVSGYETNTTLYQFLAQTIAYRKQAQVWENPQVERYCDDSFYAFTRGDTLVLTTNVGSDGSPVKRTITYQPWVTGTTLCNLYDASDCVKVTSNSISIVLTNGEPKIYYPAPPTSYL